MIVAFDVDGTLVSYQDRPNYRVIELLRWFAANNDRVYVWSGGGIDYAQRWVGRLGLDLIVEAVIPKTKEAGIEYGIDLAIDDEIVELGKINLKV